MYQKKKKFDQQLTATVVVVLDCQDIEKSVKSGTELGLADIVDDIMSKAKKLGAEYKDQPDLHTVGKEAFALCIRSMIICQEPLSQESLRTMVHFCWNHGLSEWLRTPKSNGETMKEVWKVSHRFLSKILF